MTFVPGRFVLAAPHEGELAYVTSWDTWEECSVAFEDGRMPDGHQLIDEETGRTWLPGAPYEWEAAST